MNLTDKQLLPCPFCGGEAMLHLIEQDGPNFNGQYIDCVRCGSSTNLMFSVKEDCVPILREKWNTRAGQAAASVPREPTVAMIDAGWLKVNRRVCDNGDNYALADLWRAMYDAAPAVAQEAAKDGDDDLLRRLDRRCACPRCSECESERSEAAARIRALREEKARLYVSLELMCRKAERAEAERDAAIKALRQSNLLRLAVLNGAKP